MPAMYHIDSRACVLRRFMLAIAAGFVAGAGMLGCEERGIEERAVQKGVERVPERATTDGGATEGTTPAGETTEEETSKEIESEVDGLEAVDRSSTHDPGVPWRVPEGWTKDREPRQMRVATYIAPTPAGPIEVAITRFPGRVGGELANINRWRGQMGLASIGEDELESTIGRFASPGYEGYQARIESSAGVMLAAGVYDAAIDQTWFVRATAPDARAADGLQRGVFGLARSIAGLGG